MSNIGATSKSGKTAKMCERSALRDGDDALTSPSKEREGKANASNHPYCTL